MARAMLGFRRSESGAGQRVGNLQKPRLAFGDLKPSVVEQEPGLVV